MLEMKCLRIVCDVRWFACIKSERVREMCDYIKNMVEGGEENMLKCFVPSTSRISEEVPKTEDWAFKGISSIGTFLCSFFLKIKNGREGFPVPCYLPF